MALSQPLPLSLLGAWRNLETFVAEAKVSQFSQERKEGNICCGNKFSFSETKNVFACLKSKYCPIPDTNIASETYDSQFSDPGKSKQEAMFPGLAMPLSS